MKILIAFLTTISFAVAQPLIGGSLQYENTPLKADKFYGFDPYGYVYFRIDNVLHKYGKNVNLEYQNLSFGKIKRVDIANPLNVVVFYENFNTAILLDNQFNETRRIKFAELSPQIIASAVGMASQNRLWVYSDIAQQLMLYDFVRNASTNISTPFKSPIVQYYSDFNTFSWIDKNHDWFRSDIFGKVTSLGKVDPAEVSTIIGDGKRISMADSKLMMYDSTLQKTYSLDIPVKSLEGLYYNEQNLSIFTDQQITRYKITTP